MYKLALLFFVGAATAQFNCPAEDGYYPDPNQCDKYYDCYRGRMEEKLCPDGLMFDWTLSPKDEQCNYPFIVECPANTVLQPAQQSGIECPRQNGYFEHEDPANCEEYYECTGGLAVKRTCAKGLVFDEFSGTCQWEHSGLRTGCGKRTVEVLADGFSCPNVTQVLADGQTLDHTRHLKDGDCRFYYICHHGVEPRLVGCPPGTVFNDVTLSCDAPENVPGCENWYDNEPLTGLAAAGLV